MLARIVGGFDPGERFGMSVIDFQVLADGLFELLG
jgi:hypothetical protein